LGGTEKPAEKEQDPYLQLSVGGSRKNEAIPVDNFLCLDSALTLLVGHAAMKAC